MLSFFEKIRSFSLKEIVSLRKKSNENILILISYKKKSLKDLKHHILSKDSKNSNLKSIALVAQQSLKKKVVIDGKECTVRYDIENYITSLQGQAVKALTDLKIYQDVNFKHQVDHLICKGDVFQALKIELTKGGTPRLKLPNGYVTANNRFVELTTLPLSKKKVVIVGKEYTVRYDIENYITSLQGQAVKALTDLKIYQDVNFKHQVDHLICKGD